MQIFGRFDLALKSLCLAFAVRKTAVESSRRVRARALQSYEKCGRKEDDGMKFEL